MSTLIRHRSGTYYLVFSRSGKRVWRSLRTRDRKMAYQMFLKHEQQPEEKEGLTLVKAQGLFLPFVGLALHDTLNPADVYAVYGKPARVIDMKTVNFEEEWGRGEPFLTDMGEAGFYINYPRLALRFSVWHGLVEDIWFEKR